MTKSINTKRGYVAIIGSGPAGLFTTWTLQNNRYTIMIFEKVSF